MTNANRLYTAAASLLLVAACGYIGAQPSLADLVEHQAAYDGRDVVVTGRVAMIDDPYHYWLEDDDFNRVGLEPPDAVSDHVGERVIIRGMFSYSPDAGRSLRVADVTLAPAPDDL